jgi:hypothetical protein
LTEPSVAQPPWPEHAFFPAQECFAVIFAAAAMFFLEPSVAQPPWPVQEFLPAQACFSTFAALCFAVSWLAESGVGGAAARATVPPSKPVIAAVSISEFFETFTPIFSSNALIDLQWAFGCDCTVIWRPKLPVKQVYAAGSEIGCWFANFVTSLAEWGEHRKSIWSGWALPFHAFE